MSTHLSTLRDYVRLVFRWKIALIIPLLVSMVLAVPVVYYAMDRWLDTFPYHTNIGLGTFALAGLLALLIAIVTISYQAVKAAIANPVEALRYE